MNFESISEKLTENLLLYSKRNIIGSYQATKPDIKSKSKSNIKSANEEVDERLSFSENVPALSNIHTPSLHSPAVIPNW